MSLLPSSSMLTVARHPNPPSHNPRPLPPRPNRPLHNLHKPQPQPPRKPHPLHPRQNPPHTNHLFHHPLRPPHLPILHFYLPHRRMVRSRKIPRRLHQHIEFVSRGGPSRETRVVE